MEGLPSAIAWDTVQDYVVFDSMDDYLKRLKITKKKKRKQGLRSLFGPPPE